MELSVDRSVDPSPLSPQLPDSAPYFLKKAATIGEADYLPSDEDVLRARSQTTGVNSMDFMVSYGITS